MAEPTICSRCGKPFAPMLVAAFELDPKTGRYEEIGVIAVQGNGMVIRHSMTTGMLESVHLTAVNACRCYSKGLQARWKAAP